MLLHFWCWIFDDLIVLWPHSSWKICPYARFGLQFFFWAIEPSYSHLAVYYCQESKPNIDIHLPQHITSTFCVWQVCFIYLPGLPKDQFFLYGLQNDSVRLPSHQLLSLPHSEAWKLSSADIEVLFANQNLALFTDLLLLDAFGA